jgi:hypothetical protein
MVCEGEYPLMPIERGPDLPGIWRDGQPIRGAVPQPLIYTLDPDYPGTPKAMYYEKAIPVVREDVIKALRQAGVDNVQYFDAVLRDPRNGTEFTDYKAYNIIGLVACADMEASKRMGISNSVMGDVDFESLVIDETRTGGLLLFRLAENVGATVVHEKVKEAIEAAGIPGFVFYGPAGWSG